MSRAFPVSVIGFSGRKKPALGGLRGGFAATTTAATCALNILFSGKINATALKRSFDA
jgi:hypothetical protein